MRNILHINVEITNIGTTEQNMNSIRIPQKMKKKIDESKLKR